jgi:hypothetical protein
MNLAILTTGRKQQTQERDTYEIEGTSSGKTLGFSLLQNLC